MGPCAELRRALARRGWAVSALVLMLCSSPRGSGRVRGCSSVTRPVHRQYMRAWAHTNTHTHPAIKNKKTAPTQSHMHIHLNITPPACLHFSKVISRSLGGLTHHRDTGWTLLIFWKGYLGCPFCCFGTTCRYILFCEWEYKLVMCEGHQEKHMKKEAELLRSYQVIRSVCLVSQNGAALL